MVSLTSSNTCRLTRSIIGLPLGSPLTRLYKAWSSIILLLDLVYTAFLVPVLVGFEISDVDFGWGCLVNLIAGEFSDMHLYSSSFVQSSSSPRQYLILFLEGAIPIL